MTTNTTDPQTTNHPLERGRTFRHWGGTWTLVAPTPDGEGSWVAVNTDTHAMAILTVVDVVWTGQTLDDDQLAIEVATAWHALHQRWENVQARLAEKEQMITDIRAYAIDRHLEGAFCRDGLNTALEHFDLTPTSPDTRSPSPSKPPCTSPPTTPTALNGGSGTSSTGSPTQGTTTTTRSRSPWTTPRSATPKPPSVAERHQSGPGHIARPQHVRVPATASRRDPARTAGRDDCPIPGTAHAPAPTG